ncbi:hypothetical protein Lal_00004614 [Lupinus albus]|uniref:Uncharacterized protein n=1 Tax=Lupinus albus TaxID=3870 RepID=A0A6A5M0S5_LUPAL|nr:hypothetical protein Lalb_Chr23g0273221 [Lupinus albus]KAF1865240.1 hypothetical protein Lal_00004614 [Lupinus albus]
MQQQQHHVSPSLSFRLTSYSSSETLAEIAARVIEELRWDPHHSIFDGEEPWENGGSVNDNDTNKNDDEFDFSFVPREPNTSPVSADDIFSNGQIKPVFPIFGRTLNDTVSPINNTNQHEQGDEKKRRRIPLRKLMLEEQETSSFSSSTDESVDLEDVTEGNYCVWTPQSVGVKDRKKKISSTGFVSKRWKLRNLVLGSEGKEKVSKRTNTVANNSSGDFSDRALVKAVKDGEQIKIKSFLPYMHGLIGPFAQVK